MSKANTEWYFEVFGEEPETRKYPSERLVIDSGETAVVKFLESKPRTVQTKYGTRAVIVVEHEGVKKSLWLSRKGLAREIVKLQKSIGSLEGLTVEITCESQEVIPFVYKVAVVKPSE